MISLDIILFIIFAHWFADFVMQSNEVALNKSKNNMVLLEHVLMYSVGLWIVPFFMFITNQFEYIILTWVLLNAILHGLVDYITSRTVAYYWNTDRHKAFVVIGVDQAIHLSLLFITYVWMFN